MHCIQLHMYVSENFLLRIGYVYRKDVNHAYRFREETLRICNKVFPDCWYAFINVDIIE